jgi:hypothetical protein
MKLVLSVFVLVSASFALAQDPPAPSANDWKIYVEMKVFAGTAKKLNPLVAELRDETKVNDAAAKLEKMTESGDAELVGTIATQTIDSHKIYAFQGEQIRYPIEFEIASVIEGKAGQAANPDGRRDIAYPITTYETRDVGLSLEFDPSVSDDGKRFVVYAKPKRSWFLKWDEFEIGRLANNDKIITKQPRFAEAGSSGTFAMSNHERVLLGIHTVPGSPDKMEVMLLRVWTTPRKAQ